MELIYFINNIDDSFGLPKEQMKYIWAGFCAIFIVVVFFSVCKCLYAFVAIPLVCHIGNDILWNEQTNSNKNISINSNRSIVTPTTIDNKLQRKKSQMQSWNEGEKIHTHLTLWTTSEEQQKKNYKNNQQSSDMNKEKHRRVWRRKKNH